MPIRLFVDAPIWKTDATQLRVDIPEIELAKLSSWADDFSYRVGQSLPAALETPARPLSRGTSLTETLTTTPITPGYYRVVATVKSLAPQPLTHEGHWVRNTAVAEIWLLVTEAGGTVTPEFDESRIPAEYVTQPGPFRRRPDGRRDPGGQQRDQAPRHGPNAGDSDESFTPGRPASGSTTTITYRAIYFAVDSSAYKPLPDARYVVNVCTLQGGFECNAEDWYQLIAGGTDASGYIEFPCEGDHYDVRVSTSRAPLFNVGYTVNIASGYVPWDCGNSFDIVLPSNSARVFRNMINTYSGTANLFGIARSFIQINIADGNSSSYSPSTDEITIATDDVWGQRGVFIVAHEYGHAFHQETLWGNEGSGSCPSPHFLDTESNLQCAFSEGFADYFGSFVRPDLASFDYRSYMEANAGFPGCVQRQSVSPYTCTGGTSYEGSVIEAAYAAFLYDLTDNVVEAHDSIAAPGSYLVDLIRTCQVTYGSGWRRANGPDEVAYCAENTIDPGSHFTRRGAYPGAYAESASESGGWTSTRVRANWTWNMYEKR